MKTNKKRIAVSILTVFMMVFSVIPYMGAKADVAYAAATVEEFTINETITGISKADNGKTLYTKSFYIDNTASFNAYAEHYSYSYQDYNFKVKLYDSKGNEVSPSSGSGYLGDTTWNSSKFSTAGTYTVKLICGYTGLATGVGYKLKLTVAKDIVYTYKYASLTATATESGMENAPAVRIEYGDFDGPTGSVTDKLAIFRETNGKIRKLAISYYSGVVDNIKINYGTQYTYYIVDLSYVTGTAYTTLSNVGTVDETLTAAIKTALTDSHVMKSNTVTTKGIVVSGVKNLKVYKKGVRTVSLDWGCTYGVDQYLTGYILESYNSAGKKVASKTIKRTGFISGESIYIPYAGTSKIKVTPYEDYNGTRFYGKSQTISVTSAKLKATGGNVTKISGTKASLTINRSTGAQFTQIQQKKGTKWVNVASKATAKTVKKSWTKNKAGQTQYRFRVGLKDKNGKTYYSAWRVLNPKVNQATYTNWSLSYLSNLHGAYTSYWYPLKVNYKGNKVQVKGKFYNTGIVKRTCKVKVTFKVDGKVIGTKTVSARVGGGGTVTKTFTLDKSVKGKDLYRVTYSVKYLQRH